MTLLRPIIASLAVLVCHAASFGSPADAVAILQRACYECHGPEKQKGDLRLDSLAAITNGGESGPAIVARKADASELLKRIKLPAGDDGAMPPRGDRLSARDVQILADWINAGATWPAGSAKHWAYVAPKRPNPPADVPGTDANAHPIDRFIRARLTAEGLAPSPPAAREVLLRRLSLDLTGLPPTPAEVDAFMNDTSADAWEKAVDRLLASPQFGVKWARPWLDAARHADSHGFQRDDLRAIWAYRDWVVNALNADMPFDRFSIEQLAGDLLPNATQDQRIATGFNRNAPTNVEAGSDPEETRVNQVHDRVNTLGMVWLGTTLECAQCHDHKYDPISQKDYYQLFAFFNNTAIEAERANPKVPGSIRFLGPEMTLASEAAVATQEKLKPQIADVTRKLAARAKALAKADPEWETSLKQAAGDGPREHLLQVTDFDSTGGATHEVLADGSVLLSGDPPDKDTYTVTTRVTAAGIRAIKLETLTDPSLPGKGPGRGDEKRPNFVLNTFAATVAVPAGKPRAVRFKSATASFSQSNFPVPGAIDDDAKTAWAINPKFHEPHHAVFELAEPIDAANGAELTFTLVQNFGGGRTIGRLRLSAITGNLGGQALPAAVADALAIAPDKRKPAHNKAIAEYRVGQDAQHAKLQSQLRSLEAELAKAPVAKTLVMEELPAARPAAMFKRGDFRTPGDAVKPGTPAVLHAFDPTLPPNRLGLAQWLFSRDNPLTARVTVNRIWSEIFGQGLVTTPEDFGIKGEPASHPELLDWLATEFMGTPTPSSGSFPPGTPTSSSASARSWSLKHLIRTIVLSETYRQSSRLTPELLAKDPANKWLARGPRFRLDAEGVRDNALAVSGLLSTKLGGEPIRPPQPDGLWVKVGGQRYDYVVSPGEEKYRRGLYVVWKRAAPYPSFVAFDAPERNACRVKRARTNTPLQALTLLNDPVYVEAAIAMAGRVIAEKPDAEGRITHAFRVALSRSPDAREVALLKTLYEAERDAMTKDVVAAKQLLKDVKLPPNATPAEMAAWYAVCAAILNLDETITKG